MKVVPERAEERLSGVPDPVLCASCGVRVTAASAATDRAGAHQHRFTNPHQLVFEIGCFTDAVIATRGTGTTEHTWFPGYAWKIVICRACDSHLGWLFLREGDSFFGLILDRLSREG